MIQSYVAKDAIPQPPVGFHKLLATIKNGNQAFPQVSLLGTSFHGISVNQSITAAKGLVTSVEGFCPLNRLL